MSRRMEFEDLISVLVEEHGRMKAALGEVRLAVSVRDFASAARVLGDLDVLFKQHIADEEAQVLRLLVDAYGVKGAEDAIMIFRQHRPIYDLMGKVKRLVSLSTEELASSEASLRQLLDEHTLAEETHVFPGALATNRQRAQAPP